MKIMAIDYGDAHTGIAISDPTGTLAGFSTVINSRKADIVVEEIVRLIAGHGVTELVLDLLQKIQQPMVLDADGRVIWSYALPRTLDRRYTSSDVARFSRWYLDDYPVFCWTEDYGLFVAGTEPGSMWKYTAYASPGMLTDVAGFLLPCLLGMLAAELAVCFLLSWRGARELLALARRDNARTQWIAGVSHDVRTPLALDAALPAPARQKAGGIRTQSERLRTLIDDLNLTSKLQYGAQPLRRELLTVGPLLRQLVAQFCDSPLADQCDLSLTQRPKSLQTPPFWGGWWKTCSATASGTTRSR